MGLLPSKEKQSSILLPDVTKPVDTITEVDLENAKNRELLLNAMSLGCLEMVGDLLKKMDPDATDVYGNTLLHSALLRSDMKVESLLEALKAIDNLNALNSHGETYIFRAIDLIFNKLDVRLLQTLLGRGADPNILNTRGQSPLMVMINSDWFSKKPGLYVDIVEILLKKGANPNLLCPKDNMTPLEFAINVKAPDLVNLLWKYTKINDTKTKSV